ncbi:MAG: hypothetical protein ACLTBV_08010 [Enterocloster bolteae]
MTTKPGRLSGQVTRANRDNNRPQGGGYQGNRPQGGYQGGQGGYQGNREGSQAGPREAAIRAADRQGGYQGSQEAPGQTVTATDPRRRLPGQQTPGRLSGPAGRLPGQPRQNLRAAAIRATGPEGGYQGSRPQGGGYQGNRDNRPQGGGYQGNRPQGGAIRRSRPQGGAIRDRPQGVMQVIRTRMQGIHRGRNDSRRPGARDGKSVL